MKLTRIHIARIIAVLLSVGLLIFGVYTLTQSTPDQPTPAQPTPAQSDPPPAMAVMVKITCDRVVEETVSNYNGEYTPRNITVPVGATVTWNNTDVKEHSVVSDDGLFSANLEVGETFSYTFTKPGIFVYRSDIYALDGKVTVVEVMAE